MAVTDKLKGMVEELRQDLNEVKDQVKRLLPLGKSEPELPVRQQTTDHPIVALQQETNRLFDEFLRQSMNPFSNAFVATAGGWPRMDIEESPSEVHIKADLAGMDRDDVDVSVAEGVLTIRGEKQHDDQEAGRHHYRRERFYGTFSRSVQIPTAIDLDRIKARMKNGVLHIAIPKLEDHETTRRRVPIGQHS